MPKISLCMIVRNEEKCLAKCLASVQGIVEEIIVVDTGSEDETKRIAAGFAAKVIDFIWTGSFADARNASLEAASGDWILFLDADEYLEQASHEALRKATAQTDVEGYYIPIINIYGNDQQPEQCRDILFRLFRNRSDYRFRGIIHEQVLNSILEKDQNARIESAQDIFIYHYGYLDSQVQEKDKVTRNLAMLEQQLKDNPGDKYVCYQYGLELYRAERYREAIEMLKQALAGLTPGGPEGMYFPKLIRLLVMAHYQAGSYEEAIEYVKYGLSIYPNYADIYHYGGLCFYVLRAYGTSFEYFMQAVKQGEQAYIYGAYPGMNGYKSYFYMGKICEEFGNEEEALGYYLTGFRENPAFHIALEQIIRILVKGEEREDVRKTLAHMCECCTAEAKYLIGRMLFVEHSYQLAGEYFEEAVAAGLNTAEVKICLAICLGQQDRVNEAFRLLDEYVYHEEHSTRALFNKVVISWLQNNAFKVRSFTESLMLKGLEGDFEAIVRLLRASPKDNFGLVALRPDSSEVLFDILLRAIDHGDFIKVDEILARMQQAWLNTYALRLMQMYASYNRLVEAERYGYICFGNHQENFAALMCMGDIKSKKAEYWEATEYYRAAVSADPGNPRAYIKLLKIYDKLCLVTLKMAVEKHPDVELFKVMLAQEEAEL